MTSGPCALCRATSTHMAMNDRRCSFGPDGRFRSGGSHCASIEALLALATFKVPSRAKEMHIAFVRGDGDAMLVLGWRKSMASVECASVWAPLGEAIETAPLTLAVAEELISQATARVGT